MNLSDIREQIDRVDRAMIGLLNQRVELARKVGEVKRAQGAEFYVPSREEQVFRKLACVSREAQGHLSEDAIRSIWREIISACIALEKQLLVGYLGPEATFTEQAARKNFGMSVTYKPLPAIPDVFGAVEQGDTDYGVVPIENSNGGVVFHSLDMLAETNLKIIAQTFLDIEHCLISRSPLDKITTVASKDQAIVQCRKWLQRNLPEAALVERESTAAAVIEAGSREGMAAIASSLAATRYDVPIVQRRINDVPLNVTRFLVIGRECSPPTGPNLDRSSIVFSLKDQVGALMSVLEAFAKRGINLLKIESRPNPKRAWDYLFFVDFCGHIQDALVKEVMSELETRCSWVKWLGSYPS